MTSAASARQLAIDNQSEPPASSTFSTNENHCLEELSTIISLFVAQIPIDPLSHLDRKISITVGIAHRPLRGELKVFIRVTAFWATSASIRIILDLITYCTYKMCALMNEPVGLPQGS
jgi:hypothetical protein